MEYEEDDVDEYGGDTTMTEEFERLVDNAIDFLQHSVEEIETDPKYSIIHFYSAVELFLKARLQSEHWTLIISKNQDPDRKKFKEGDFKSVTLEEAKDRLNKVLGSDLESHVYKAFDDVRKHRNKLVHFYHRDQDREAHNRVQTDIIRQQLKAWYHLNQLLSCKWKDLFETWHDKLVNIGAKLRKHSSFLSVVFEQQMPTIKSQEIVGYVFLECPSCSYKAEKHESKQNHLYEAECLVCGFTETCLNINCKDCSSNILFRSEGYASCSECGKKYDPESLAELLHCRGRDSDFREEICNCDCGGYHTVYITEDGEYACAQCFYTYDNIEQCEWCYEFNTGSMENSYLNGCDHCQGSLSYHGCK